MSAALDVRDVTVRYGGNIAVRDVSFDAEPGAVTGLIGPNGAGKTTLFNVVSGLLSPANGRVSLAGRDVTRRRPHERSRLGLARTFQRLELFTLLSVRGNVRVAASMSRRHRHRDAEPDRVADEVLERVGLSAFADAPVGDLPTGQARLVEVARALATSPSVLLLDEPASGQDDRETAAFADLLLGLAADGIAVVLVEHDVELVFRVCSMVHVLDFGELLASGSPATIKADARVRDAYLGVSA